MKYITFAALSLFSLMASAADTTASSAPQTTVQSEEYDYSQDLDIAKVVRLTSTADSATECGLVEAHMVYVDSKGVTHNLKYSRLGDGCQSG
jgi:hypothetical protein